MAADQARHRRGADAGARPHAARRRAARPRLCRALLHRLRESSSAICSAATTDSQRTPHGRPTSPAFPPPRSSPWRAGCRAGARWSRSRIRCSARNMASSRSGWARCSRRCSARSACRAAALTTRSARSATPARRPNAVADSDAAAGQQRRQRLHPGGAHQPTCCSIRASRSTSTASALHLSRHPAGLLGRRQSVPSSPGHQPAAPRLQRPETIVVHESAWTATARHRRHRAAGDHDAGARRHRRRRHRPECWSRCSRRSSRSARRATTTTSSPRWRERLGVERGLHRGPRQPRNGCAISTSRRGARWPTPAACAGLRRVLGRRANSRCRAAR